MPGHYGSKKQNTGGAKSGAGQPASGNFDVGGGNMGFGGGKAGARGGLAASNAGGEWSDTDNSMPSDDGAFGVGRPGGSSNPVGVTVVNHSGQPVGSGSGGPERGMKVNNRGY